MQIDTPVALLLLVVFVLPGFAVTLFKERAYKLKRQYSNFDRTMETLYYSVVVYSWFVALLVALDRLWSKHFPGNWDEVQQSIEGDVGFARYFIVAAALLGLALVVSESGRRWVRSKSRKKFRKLVSLDDGHETDSAWDHAFTRVEPQFVARVLMKSGQAIVGTVGEGSFSTKSLLGNDLFLEKQWSLNEDLEPTSLLPGSQGVWIASDEIAAIEFVGESAFNAEGVLASDNQSS